MITGWLALVSWVLAPAAWANVYRFGLFVGNNEGQPGDVELVFAEADAEKMRDLFVEYGEIKPSDAVLLQGAGAHAVQHEFERLSSQIDVLVADGHEAVFVFYYSGHGDDESLHLGATKIEHVNLRTWIERTHAQVRIGLVDACQSGGLVRQKGGERGTSLAFSEPVVESVHGSAIITSSSASELSQESEEIGGGFFTHYLHTALSGGADRNRDGEVSLSEAYAYVHSETAFHTRDAPELQTPNWDLDLAGAGDLVLTTLEDATSRLAFLGDLEGTYAVWDESRKRYVAQVDGSSPVSLAVRPGTFYVHKRMPGWVEESHYTLRRGETHSVLEEDFVTVSYAQVASRGDLEKAVRRSKIPDLSLRFTLGARSFVDPYRAYATPLALGGIQATLLGRKATYFSFDLRTGANTTELVIEELAPIETHQSAVTVGAVAGIATPPNWVRAGIGARTTFNVMSRWFPAWDLEPQSRGWVGVGGSAWAGASFGRITFDVQYDVQMMPVSWYGTEGWPIYGDLSLVGGYRF